MEKNQHSNHSFPVNYEDLPLDSEERPIEILGTYQAQVPEGSEPFVDHKVDRVKFPNGNIGWYHRVRIPHGVMVAHLDDKKKIALVTNFRHAMGRHSVELPSGGVDENESSLLGVFTPEDAARIVDIAKEQDISIMDLLGPDQAEEVLRNAAVREMSEEIGWAVKPEKLKRLIPGVLRGAVGLSGNTHNIFYSKGGHPVPMHHDDGEAGMITHKRYSLKKARKMIGKEIVEPATVAAILKLSLKSKKDRKHRS
jgi:8-oxo-dGTP pyrophosphatase MutT (NUDIX family)